MKNYLCVWRQFNDFIMCLDMIPESWEERTLLFIAHMIEVCKAQSSTVKSYVSAIKRMLIDDNYKWDNNKILLTLLTRACRLINDRLQTRLPIHCGLLEILIFELECTFADKEYLKILYRAMLLIGYYGLMRIGEITDSPHIVKAKNVHVGTNKEKILLILYSSKTHHKGNRPQKIKIMANKLKKTGHYAKRYFCPFKAMRQYLTLRGSYSDEDKNFFVYRDRSCILNSGQKSGSCSRTG